jgi:hypothetical protein
VLTKIIPRSNLQIHSYLYGGLRPNGVNVNGSTAFDDVYILSIPAFVWIKWYPKTPVSPNPHHSLTCDVINGTQTIVMGGIFPDSNSCDVPNVYGQHNLNLAQNNLFNALWIAFVLNFPPYTLPSAITQLIGGTFVFRHRLTERSVADLNFRAKGGSNVTEPLNETVAYDWYLFQRPYNVPTRTPTPTTVPSSNAKSPKTQTAMVGAIIGSVIGGILLGGVAFYALVTYQKQRRRAKAQELANEDYRMMELVKKPLPLAYAELDGQSSSELPDNRSMARELWHPPIELPGTNDRLR